MSNSLRLSDVLARSIAIEWFEAVALVRDVGEHVREALGGQGIPELHQIELTSDGQVVLSGAVRTDEPVRRLGQLLQAALVHSDPPVQLRLAVAQATAPTPAFGSVREYSEALAYFERPHRSAVLRGLYDRAATAPAPEAPAEPTLDDIAPLERAAPKKVEKPAAQQQMKKRRGLPAAAAAVIVTVGGAAYWQFAPATPSGKPVSELAVKTSDAVGTAIVSGLSSITDAAGLGRLAPAQESRAIPSVQPPFAPQEKPASTRKGEARPTTNRPAFKVFDLPVDSARTLPGLALPAAPSAAAAVPTSSEPDSAVYSATDADVLAPVGVRPQLPRALPPDVDREQLAQIELLILSDGSVGSVKLLGRPRSVIEGMLLSAAKAWTFTPATKDGRPVAYRKLVWLVLP